MALSIDRWDLVPGELAAVGIQFVWCNKDPEISMIDESRWPAFHCKHLPRPNLHGKIDKDQ